MPNYRPLTPDRLARTVAAARRDGHTLVAVDGADSADPVDFAHRVVAAARAEGRPAEVVDLHDFVRPASQRLEFGRTDELSYRTAWFDYAAVRREVVDALRAHDRWLPALWDEIHDRSARARLRPALPGTVLVTAGPMLLGRDLDFDITVRLDMSAPALTRRTPAEAHWTLPALAAHHRDHPDTADFTVRWDHPDHPALLTP